MNKVTRPPDVEALEKEVEKAGFSYEIKPVFSETELLGWGAWLVDENRWFTDSDRRIDKDD